MARESYVKKAWQYDPETGASGWFPVLDPLTGDPIVVDGEVAVDYVWGNFPLQPDDDREEGGNETAFGGGTDDNGWAATHTFASDLLQTEDYSVEFNNVGGTVDVPADNHINASVAWNGYPGYDPEYPFMDTDLNTVVPNVVGLTESAANSALVAADLVKGAVTTTTAGAVFTIDQGTKVNSSNLVTVRTTAAHGIAEGDSVAVTLSTTGWTTLGGTVTVTAPVTSTTFSFVDTDVDADGTDVTIAGSVVKSALVGKVKTQNPVANANANVGDAVALVKYAAS